MHFERAFLGEYFAALFAHEADVMRSETVFVQLNFQRERIFAGAAFERSVTAVIDGDVMILKDGGNLENCFRSSDRLQIRETLRLEKTK